MYLSVYMRERAWDVFAFVYVCLHVCNYTCVCRCTDMYVHVEARG